MKNWILMLLLIVTSSAAYADDAARKQCEDKLVLLTNGMTRFQVEEIFPMAGTQRFIESADSYTLIYNIDNETAITLRYDYSENQMEAHGKASAAQNPDNRLIGTMGLSASKIGPPKKIEKTIHPKKPRTSKMPFRRSHWTTSPKTHP